MPGYKFFGYVAIFVGMVIVLGTLVARSHGRPSDWWDLVPGSAAIVAGCLWIRRKA